ncbi:MAG: hypothetical protein ACK57P_01075, partial [Planctomycetota bacterium]
RNRLMFGLYTVASFIYRWFVAFSIIMFLNAVLKPYGLQSLGRAFAVAGVVGMIVPGFVAVYKFFKTPGRANKIKSGNVLTSLSIATAILGFIAFFPLPFYVYCPTEIQPEGAKEIRNLAAGKIKRWNKQPQQAIQKDEVLCELENSQLEYDRTKAWGELQTSRIRLADLERAAATASDKITLLRMQQEDVTSKLNLYNVLDNKYKNLIIRSPIDGIVFRPPPKEESRAAKAQEQLPSWYGDPFDAINSEVYFQEGDLICLVAPKPLMEGVMIVDQHDRDLLRIDDKVSIMLESARLETLRGKITGFSTSEIKDAPPQLAIASGGTLDTKTDETGRTIPISTSYQVRVALKGDDLPVRPSYRGEARVHLKWRSLGWRLYRYFMTTFNFEF